MSTDLATFLRLLARLVAVIVLSAVVGYGLGYGLSELRGGSGDTTPPAFLGDAAAATPPAGATGPSATTSAGGSAAARVSVVSSTFEPATTVSGRQRRRARVAVKLRITAGSSRTTLTSARLASGADSLSFDPNARDVAGTLLDPIAAGKSATGQLNFETAGAITPRLAAQRTAKLTVLGRTLTLTLTAP